jgi:hypothetical protein
MQTRKPRNATQRLVASMAIEVGERHDKPVLQIAIEASHEMTHGHVVLMAIRLGGTGPGMAITTSARVFSARIGCAKPISTESQWYPAQTGQRSPARVRLRREERGRTAEPDRIERRPLAHRQKGSRLP